MRFLCLTVSVLVASCSLPSESGLQHQFGKTKRSANAALKPCTVAEPATPELKSATSYVTKIARYIMGRNPQTFNGEFAPEKFCFSADQSFMVNAYAEPSERKVVFQQGILEALANDGQAAAVMAHELAHVTMQHIQDFEPEEIEKDSRWHSTATPIREELKRNYERQNALRSAQIAIADEHAKVEDSLDKALAANGGDLLAKRDKLAANSLELQQELQVIFLGQNQRPDFWAWISLQNMVNPPTPRVSLFDFDSREETSTAQDYKTFRTKAESYQKEREAWIRAEEQALPELWAKYKGVVSRGKEIAAENQNLYLANAKLNTRLDDLRKSIMADWSPNWREKEADDVGLEFFLRAGLAPLNYQGMFEMLNAKSQTAAASCAVETAKSLVERGQESHPAACWRYYNAKVVEMTEHAADYAPLVEKAVTTEIAPGELDTLKKTLSQTKNTQNP